MSEQEKFPVEQFKKLLITFLKNNFRSSGLIISVIESDNTESELKNSLTLYAEEFYQLLGGELPDFDNGDYDDLEDEVRYLKQQNEELEYELSKLEGVFGESLDDQFKIRAIVEHINNYTSWELEELLKDGKKYLKK